MGLPFAWGETDCAVLCLEAFDALTGRRLADVYRGRWNSRPTAIRFARDHDLVQVLDVAGCRRIDSGFQQRGDLLLVPAHPFVEGHVCLGRNALSSWVGQAVDIGRSRDVLALRGAIVLRAE